MRYFKFLAIGVLFGIIMVKSEALSWYRIYEMFHFDSFHMYGIIGSAVLLGAVTIQFIKRSNFKAVNGDDIIINSKKSGFVNYMLGGIIFGLGWALVGACPGPIFVLIGAGYIPMLVVLLGAVIGTFVFGLLKDKLPY